MNKARRSFRSRKPTTLVFSLVLIALSVTGVFIFVEQNKVTESFLITKIDLASGSPVSSLEVESVEVSLFEAASNYLKPSDLPADAYLLRPLAKGELIPISAITNSELAGSSNIVIKPAIEISSLVRPGQMVSLWSAPRIDYSSYGEPILIALQVEVVAVREPESGFLGSMPSVELRVPTDVLEYLIRAIANEDALAITGAAQLEPGA